LKSTLPPAEYGTISVMGLAAGHVACANAAPGKTAANIEAERKKGRGLDWGMVIFIFDS
jgi:hypothetical protein